MLNYVLTVELHIYCRSHSKRFLQQLLSVKKESGPGMKECGTESFSSEYKTIH